MDITQLILDDHHEQRRLFGILEQIAPTDIAGLAAIWGRLLSHCEAHVEAEERIFYPELLQLGKRVGKVTSSTAETKDAIKDHNEIRDAVVLISRCQIGSDPWYAAIGVLNKANSEHMAEEEREGLSDFHREAPLQLRHDLAVAFAVFEATHVTGVATTNKDPNTYIANNG